MLGYVLMNGTSLPLHEEK